MTILTQTIFLSAMPATNRFCLSSSGLNFMQYGTLRFVNRPKHAPKHNNIKIQRYNNDNSFLLRHTPLHISVNFVSKIFSDI